MSAGEVSAGPGVSVRRAAEADLPAVFALAGEVPEGPRWRFEHYDEVLRGQAPPGCTRCLLVAELAAAAGIAGFAALSCVWEQATLENLVVGQAARRGGVATALCRAGIVWAAGEGADDLMLEVRSRNAAARALYVRLGFAEHGLRRGYYSAPGDDAVVMRLPLLPAEHASAAG